jgi:hypothetical protein
LRVTGVVRDPMHQVREAVTFMESES